MSSTIVPEETSRPGDLTALAGEDGGRDPFLAALGERLRGLRGRRGLTRKALKFIERQAIRAKLYLTKATKNEEYLERVRGELMDGEEFQFRKEKGEYVACYRNK